MSGLGVEGSTRDDLPPTELGLILAGLGGEIRHPLESLRRGIDRLLADPTGPISEAERAQAATMLGLCEDLDQLTGEYLGSGSRSSDV